MLENIKYEKICVERELNGDYIKTKIALIKCIINGVEQQIFEKDPEIIERHIEKFCQQKGMNSYQLEKEGSLVYYMHDKKKVKNSSSYSRYNESATYYSRKLKDNVSSAFSNLVRPYRLKKLAKNAMILVTAGAITIGGISVFKNCKLKHDNIYNNKHVKLSVYSSESSKIEGDMYDVLAGYSEFDEIMTSAINGDWNNLKGKNLDNFFEDLQVILNANYDIVYDRYTTKPYNPSGYDRVDKYKRPIYDINLASYFQNSKNEYCAVDYFQTQSDFAFWLSIPNSDSLDNEMKRYLDKVIGFVMDGQCLNGFNTVYGNFGCYYNNLSPLAKYTIVETAITYLELYNFEGTYIYKGNTTFRSFTKNEVLNSFRSISENIQRQIKNDANRDFNSKKAM